MNNRELLDNSKLKNTLRYAERDGNKKLADWCRQQLERRKA